MRRPKLFVSFSGGRTSGFMAWWITQNFSDQFEIVVVFANTGSEANETLDFVDQCDREWGLGVVWVEAVVHHDERKSCTHKVVDYQSASRNHEPFEEVIKKYGIPNTSFPHCTRELKLNPMLSYIRSLGWKDFTTAIGIRADEVDRMNANYRENKFWYPLVKMGVTKRDVNNWWSEQPFQLELKEHQGNCEFCWKKSDRKLFTLIHENPDTFSFPRRMEDEHAYSGAGEDPRVFFRQNRSTDQMIEQSRQVFTPFTEGDDALQQPLFEMDIPGGGCSESCEAFGPDFEWEAA